MSLPGVDSSTTSSDDALAAIDLEAFQPVLPSQVTFEDLFDAGLAERVAGFVPAVGQPIELVLGDLTDIADDVGRHRAERVHPPLHLPGDHAGELVLPLLEEGEERLVDALDQHHREQLVVVEVVVLVEDLLGRHPDDGSEALDHLEELVLVVEGAHHLPVERDLADQDVVGEDLAVSVEDPPAHRVEADISHLVLLGLHDELGADEDLEEVEAGEERGEERHDDHAEHRESDPRDVMSAHRRTPGRSTSRAHRMARTATCLLYTSDAADDLVSV